MAISDRSAWARTFLATVDGADPANIASYFTPDIRLRFGNAKPLRGRDVVRTSFANTAEKIRSSKHVILGTWCGSDGDMEVVSVEADVTY